MEHYIEKIKINEVRHLSNIDISLNEKDRQHLMITGKNGSGKTSLLLALQKYLQAINDGEFNNLEGLYTQKLLEYEEKVKMAGSDAEKFEVKKNYQYCLKTVGKYKDGIEVVFNKSAELDNLYEQGEFITAFFPANRKMQIIRSHGVEDIKLRNHYGITDKPGELLHKYMVHLKTQQAYAKNEGDMVNADRIQDWFDRFVNALKILLDDDSITLEYAYKEYDFKIHMNGRKPFGFDKLSDGYSSVFDGIFSKSSIYCHNPFTVYP